MCVQNSALFQFFQFRLYICSLLTLDSGEISAFRLCCDVSVWTSRASDQNSFVLGQKRVLRRMMMMLLGNKKSRGKRETLLNYWAIKFFVFLAANIIFFFPILVRHTIARRATHVKLKISRFEWGKKRSDRLRCTLLSSRSRDDADHTIFFAASSSLTATDDP